MCCPQVGRWCRERGEGPHLAARPLPRRSASSRGCRAARRCPRRPWPGRPRRVRSPRMMDCRVGYHSFVKLIQSAKSGGVRKSSLTCRLASSQRSASSGLPVSALAAVTRAETSARTGRKPNVLDSSKATASEVRNLMSSTAASLFSESLATLKACAPAQPVCTSADAHGTAGHAELAGHVGAGRGVLEVAVPAVPLEIEGDVAVAEVGRDAIPEQVGRVGRDQARWRTGPASTSRPRRPLPSRRWG